MTDVHIVEGSGSGRQTHGVYAMSIPPQQEEIAQFFEHLAGSPPKETHISAVFVGKGTAWKLKKAVRLPFLDFTTIEARRHFLQRELQLNALHIPFAIAAFSVTGTH